MVASTEHHLGGLLKEQARLQFEVHVMNGILRYRTTNGLYGAHPGLHDRHAKVLEQARAKLARADRLVWAWKLANA